MDTNGEKEKVK